MNQLASSSQRKWTAMKELIIVLSILFSSGLGKENKAINELSDLKAKVERSLNLANRVNDVYNSGLRDLFTELTDKFPCLDSKVLDNDYSNFTKEVNKMILPLNDWIFQTSKKMRLLNVFLNQLHIYGDSIDLDHFRFVPDPFFGDCNSSFTKEKPKESINTNDIYEYQNKMNCEKEGGSEKFQCGSGECIDFNRTCDGVLDCWDGSDELGACGETSGCEGCSRVCAQGPRGPRCLAECPDFGYSFNFCPNSKPDNKCFSLCGRRNLLGTFSVKCLVQMFSNVLDTANENYRELLYAIYLHYWPTIQKCQNERSNLNENINLATTDNTNYFEGHYTTSPNWYTTTRHPTWHPTTRHPTWHPTTRHPTWHPTTRHPTWHPTTRHPTWHPTTRHTTRHPTWPPTTSHPTWHPTTRHTTRHPTWHPTTSHPTWHPTTKHTTRHPTWHPTTRHTTRHPTWHPTTRHTTWHPTTRHTTWPTTTPAASESIGDLNESDYSDQTDQTNHHTTKHTTPHSTTAHTKHTTKHHTTKHTTKHTTHHTTTPTTSTTPHTTTTPSKSTTSPTTTTTADEPYIILY